VKEKIDVSYWDAEKGSKAAEDEALVEA